MKTIGEYTFATVTYDEVGIDFHSMSSVSSNMLKDD